MAALDSFIGFIKSQGALATVTPPAQAVGQPNRPAFQAMMYGQVLSSALAEQIGLNLQGGANVGFANGYVFLMDPSIDVRIADRVTWFGNTWAVSMIQYLVHEGAVQLLVALGNAAN